MLGWDHLIQYGTRKHGKHVVGMAAHPSASFGNLLRRYRLAGSLTQEELAERAQTIHLLTLTGTGGCVKTRLAIEVARSFGDAYPDVVWLSELAPIGDPILLPHTIARALGVQEEPATPIVQTLLGFLQA